MELSIEEKARRYDQAIERANELLYVSDKESVQYKTIERILPELKESEDEKIKESFKRLIKAFHDTNFPTPEGFSREDMLNWLKKQGEQKPIEIIPKFRVGDIITNGKIIGKVDENENNKYHGWFGYNKDLGVHYADIPDVDNWHLWTIQDAKKGDVLTTDNVHFIFNKIDEDGFVYMICNCSVMSDGLNTSDTAVVNSEYVHPATKEQRNLLLQKIKENSYEWDANKKELKKIEQNPTDKAEPKFKAGDWAVSKFDGKARQISEVHYDGYNNYYVVNGKEYDINEYDRLHYLRKNEQASVWSEEDEDAISMATIALEGMYDPDEPNSTYAGFTMPFNKAALRLRYLKERVLPKAEWSEEDSMHLTNAILAAEKEWGIESCTSKWLKSFEIRGMWKPSEEQMGILHKTFHYVSEADQKILQSLYNDLKKL